MAAVIDNIDSGAVADSLQRLTRDLKAAAGTLTTHQARFLVDDYYILQRDRIRAFHQNRTLEENAEPHSVLDFFAQQCLIIEKQLGRALDTYSDSQPLGQWARSITGVGPIFAAGLLANIDIRKAKTVGHIWRFAGLDPTNKWLGREKASELVEAVLSAGLPQQPVRRRRGAEISEEAYVEICRRLNTHPERLRQRLVDRKTGEVALRRRELVKAIAKRPWNASLKRLLFLVGESFVKVQNNSQDIYGKVYVQRKAWETANNEQGLYAQQAADALKAKKYGDDTEARQHYEAGHLPPAQIHRRSTRYAVKLFLADYHCVGYFMEFKKLPPKPYVVSHLGHAHYHGPPNTHLVPGLTKALAKA